MSKMQKVIRDIAKQQSGEKESTRAMPLGKVVSEHAAPEIAEPVAKVELGDETQIQRRLLIDREAMRREGFLAPEDEERVLVDQYRQIKRPLIAHAFGKRATKIPDGHLILISSAIAGDGKTFTCLNLALSMAREQDRSVLLVDADVAKAHITRLFGAEDQPGLLDMLEDDSEFNLNDAILETDIKGLSVMTAGLMRTHSTELLASERMESLIRDLGAQDPNRIVIFDSSPLLATSESRELTSLVGQAVLVVAAELTPQQAVMAALAVVDQGKPVNLVLNQARHSSSNGYYGYGYGRDSKGERND